MLCPKSNMPPSFLGPETTLILSGILDSRLPDVEQALTNAGLTITSCRQKEDWRCLTAQRRTT